MTDQDHELMNEILDRDHAEFEEDCRYSGESPRFTPDCKHPVHRGELPPSAKSCEGCDSLRWEELSPPSISRRRRVCMWHDLPRIPGNLTECPILYFKEHSRELEAVAEHVESERQLLEASS